MPDGVGGVARAEAMPTTDASKEGERARESCDRYDGADRPRH